MSERDPHIDGPVPDGPGGGPNGAPKTPAAEVTAARRSPARRVLRGVLLTLGGLVGLVIALFLLVFLLLQTEWGQDRARTFLEQRLNALVDGAHFEIGDLEGNVIGRLVLSDVNLVRDEPGFGDEERLAHIDTLTAGYNLLPLLRNRLRLYRIDIIDPHVWMEQQEDGAWDLLQVFARDDSAAVDTATARTTLVLELDRLDLVRGGLSARFYNPGRDSLLLGRDIHLSLGSVNFEDYLVFEADTAWAAFNLPTDTTWIDFAAGGALTEQAIVLDGLSLASPRSEVYGAGTLRLPEDEGDLVDDVDFWLRASPLAFDDVRPLVPTLAPGVTVTLDAEVEGAGRLFDVELDAAFSPGGTVSAAGTLSPSTDGPVAYDFRATVRDLDPAALLTTVEAETRLSADLSVDLAGTTVDALDGTVDARVLGAQFGTYLVDDARLQAAFDGGTAEVDFAGTLNATPLTARGVVRPFDDIPYYSLRGRVTGLDVRNFQPNTPEDDGFATDVTASYRVQGYGLDVETAEIEADLTLAASTINRYVVETGTLQLRLEGGDLGVVARLVSPHGNVFADGTVTFGDPMTYRIQRGRLENFDLAAFTGSEAPSNINATFSLDGTGTRSDAINLRLDARVFDSRYDRLTIAAADLGATVRGGALRFNTTADLAEAGEVRLTGSGRPFDERPTLRITDGRFDNLDLGRLTGNPDLSTDLTGTTTFSLQGFDLAAAALDGRFSLDRSRFNDQVIEDAAATVQLRRGRLAFDGDVQLPGGEVQLAGSARPFDEVLTYTVTRGRFQGVDVGAFTGNPDLTTNLTGTFTLDGRGTDFRTARIDARLDLAPSTVNAQPINDLYGSLTLRGGDLGFDLFTTLPEGSARLQGTGDFLADVPTYTLTQGTFENVDLGALLGRPDLDTQLTGTLALDGRGLELETLALDGRITLAPSRVNDQVIDAASFAIDLEGGRLAFDGSLELPEGAADLAGTARPFLDVPTYTVTRGAFAGIDLGAFTGNPDLRSDLTGTFTLDGRGTDPSTLSLDARLALAPSVVNTARLLEGDVTVRVDGGFTQAEGTLDFEDGRAVIDAEGRFFDEVPTYTASGSLVNVDLDALTGIDTLAAEATARFSIQGRGFDPETLSLTGTVEADTTRFGDVFVETLRSTFRLESGVLTLDTLNVRSNVVDGVASGVVPLFDSTAVARTDLTFDAEIKDLSALEDLLGIERLEAGQGQVTGRLLGRPDAIRFNVETDVSSFAYNDIRLSGVAGRLSGEYDFTTGLRLGEARVQLNTLALPGLTISASDLDITYDGNEIVFNGEVLLDERREVHLTGRIDPRPDARRVRVEDLSIRLDEDEWELLTEAVITYGDAYRVSNFLLHAGDQQIAIDGVIDPDGMQNLVVTIESFRIGAVADLLGYRGLDGTLNGALDLTGPAYAPNATGALDFDLVSFGEPVGDLDLDLRYDSLRLNVDGLLTHEDGSTLSLDGYVPLDLRLAPSADTTVVGEGIALRQQATEGPRPVRFTIDADSFAVDWIEPFLDPRDVRQLEGRLEGEVLVTGTVDAPQVEGTAALIDGYADVPLLGLDYEGIHARAVLEGNRIVLSTATIRSGGGTLTARGTINLTELTLGEFDIQARLDEFRAIETREYQMSASGNVTLSGTTRRPVLTGNVSIANSDIFLTDTNTGAQIEVVELTQADLQMLEERFNYRVTERDTSTFVFYDALTMDLEVEIQRDTWIRQVINPALALQVTGQLDLEKQPFSDLQLFGSIETLEQGSYIEQFGRRFKIREGMITFNGGPLDFVVDVTAQYAVRARRSVGEEPVRIILNVEGRIDELELTFESENPAGLPLTDIISYIAVGRPAGQTFQIATPEGVLGEGAGLALDQLAGVVEGVAAEQLGLDVVEIRQEGLRGTVLVFGRYVSPEIGPYRPNVYVAVETPISFSSSSDNQGTTSAAVTRLLIELEVFQWLLLRASGGKDAFELNLLWEYAY